jgi:hypothetical protein
MMLIALRTRPSRSRPRRTRAADERGHTLHGAGAGATPSRFAPWAIYKRLTELGFPRRFPVVQFPNLPLIVAFVAGQARGFVHGAPQPYLASVSYLAMTIWAYEELTDGVNWFRRLLGLTYTAIMVMRVAHAVHS